MIQGGRVSRAQLIALGLGPGAIDHRVRVGWLHVRQRGVYAVGSPAETADGRWWEAPLAYGEEAALSHASAATVQELQRLRPGPVELTSPRSGIADRPGIRVRRSWVLLPHEVTQRRGMRVTTPGVGPVGVDLEPRDPPVDHRPREALAVAQVEELLLEGLYCA